MEVWAIWLIIAAILLVVELMTNFIAFICLAIGCVVAMVLSLFDFSLTTQIIGLILGDLVAFVTIVPLVHKFKLHKRRGRNEDCRSNMDALIGREGNLFLLDSSNSGTLRVKIDGDSWQVKSNKNEALEEGQRVKVVGYDSIILIVETI